MQHQIKREPRSNGTNEESPHTDAVACREYILPRDEETSEPKDWIRGNTKKLARIGSYNLLLAK